MSLVEKVRGREILDSRGSPTIEVEVELVDGTLGRASVPSGASTGAHEALELRDQDPRRFGGRGVLTAVAHVDEAISHALEGLSVLEQVAIDRKLIALDGTPNKSRLGANAILGASLAVAQAAANFLGIPLYRSLGGLGAHILPVPLFNILNGGKHAPGAVDFQEFMAVPVGAKAFAQALQVGSEVYYSLKEILREKGLNTTVGDEGGFAPQLSSNREAVELVLAAIKAAGYTPGEDCLIALDVAASSLFRNDSYHLEKEGLVLSRAQMMDYLEEMASSYPIISIEDGLHEEDWEGWRLLTGRLGGKVQLVGDDLYVTDPKRLAKGIEEGASNAVLIKPNQIGTLTETMEAVRLARQAGWGIIVSHRSGETEDVTIAHLAVALGCGQIKAGAPCRSERLAKYNELIRIEEELGQAARYVGKGAFRL